MKYIKLFEEFKRDHPIEFIELLKLYAEASEFVTSVTKIAADETKMTFSIDTNIPGDYKPGKKMFKVFVPSNLNDSAYIDTYESGEKVLRTSIQPKGENKMYVMLMNYIEIAQLYNDGIIEKIVSRYKEIKSVDDIKNIIKGKQ